MDNGIINVLKPPGMTSHDVVAFVRRLYSIKRVGHAGTLDPGAAGVLPVFLGQATRLVEYLADADKSYRAELTFGYETDTGDDTGQIINSQPYTLPESDRIKEVLASFIGVNAQIPPMYSAIKVGGKKLYELARAGQTIDRQPRKVVIHDISLIKVTNSGMLFDVTCSKGTYIRTLCVDIGTKLGCLAVMSFLVRTRVGDFSLECAKSLEEIAANTESAVQPADSVLDHMHGVVLSEQNSQAMLNGRSVPCDDSKNVLVRIYDWQNKFIGIGRTMSQPGGYSALVPVKIFSPG